MKRSESDVRTAKCFWRHMFLFVETRAGVTFWYAPIFQYTQISVPKSNTHLYTPLRYAILRNSGSIQ